ncbi:MAG TPA: DUF4388 domain-containing protein [Acidimicrobiales bacterium]|nr:DUF4388 domain-containing protein [Acidimicrobiales bacterium]
MPLAGTFDVLDFAEILALLARRGATGRLQVRTASMHGTIWLAEGRATAADLGGETRQKWRAAVEDLCFDALRSPRGSFEFHPDDLSAVPPGPRVRLETIVAAGKRRLESWQEVESVIQSFDAVPRLAESLGDDGLMLDPERWKVLVSVDGRRTVAALARRLDMELLDFCQLLKPLVESGAVVLEQPEGWLRSLPKVRLEGEWPGGAPPVMPSAGEGIAVLNVGSTPAPEVVSVEVAPSDAEASDGKGRWLLRGKSRAR